MIGRCGERGSGISVLAARHDDDDDDDISKYARSTKSRHYIGRSFIFILVQF